MGKLKNISTPPLLLALDSIQDPHNLGAIIRSAVAAGVNGLILPKDRSAPITGTVIKVSAGAVFHLDICRVTNLVNSFKVLKKEGIRVVAAVSVVDREEGAKEALARYKCPLISLFTKSDFLKV